MAKPVSLSNRRKFPWGAVIAVACAYILLGWHLSLYGPLWQFFVYVVTALIAILLVWGTGSIIRLVRLGPRSVFTMLILSSFITLAIIAFYIFSLIVVIAATDTLLRIEMRAAGYSSIQVLGVMLPTGLVGMVLGWLVSHVVQAEGFGLFLEG